MADEIQLEIDIDTKQATAELSKFKNTLEKDLGGIQNSFSNIGKIGAGIGAAVAAIGAGFAALGIGKFLQEGITAAADTESAISKLANQMKLSGEFTDTALQSFVDLADELEKATNVSDDLILSQASLAKSFGLTDEQTQKLLKAAVELSSVTGEDLSGSVDTLIKSYNGQTKALDKTIAGVQGLTKEQLKNGAAIDLINANYSGNAAAALNTYAGGLASVERAYEDTAKSIGGVIIKNQSLINIIGLVTKSLDSITAFLENNKGGINSFISIMVDGFFLAAKSATFLGSIIERAIGGAIIAVTVPLEGMIGALGEIAKLGGKATEGLSEGLQDASRYLKNFNAAAIDGVAQDTGAFGLLNKEIVKVQKSLKESGNEAVKASNVINNAAKKTKPVVDAEDLQKAQQEYKKLSDQIVLSVSSETQKVNIKRREQLEEIEKLGRQAGATARDIADKKVKIEESAERQISEINKKENEKRLEENRKSSEQSIKQSQAAYANPINIFYKSVFSTEGASDSELSTAGISMATGFFSALQKGAAGAKEVGGKIAGGIGEAIEGLVSDDFLFGLGGLFKELFAFTSQTPEEIKAQIKGFIEAIPDLFRNLADSGPAIAEGFIAAIFESDFLVRLIESAVRSPGLEFIGKKLGITNAESFKEVIGGFFSDVGTGIADIFKRIFSELGNAFSSAADSFLGKFISGFGTALLGIFTGVRDLFTSIYAGIAAPILEAGTKITEGIKSVFTFFKDTVDNLLSGVTDIFNQVGEFFRNAIDSIGSSIRNAFVSAFDFIKNGFAKIFAPIITAIDSLVGFVKDIGGGASSFGKKIGDVFGFAKGGVVPAGYPNDSYPAALTSGELVVPTDLVGALSQFLSNPKSAGSADTSDLSTALLSAILAKLSAPQEVTTSVQLNGKAFADIILQLNRNNARLAG